MKSDRLYRYNECKGSLGTAWDCLGSRGLMRPGGRAKAARPER